MFLRCNGARKYSKNISTVKFFTFTVCVCVLHITNLQEIVESLQQVKDKGGSCPPIRTLGMGDVTGDSRIFATCNPFQVF